MDGVCVYIYIIVKLPAGLSAQHVPSGDFRMQRDVVDSRRSSVLSSHHYATNTVHFQRPPGLGDRVNYVFIFQSTSPVALLLALPLLQDVYTSGYTYLAVWISLPRPTNVSISRILRPSFGGICCLREGSRLLLVSPRTHHEKGLGSQDAACYACFCHPKSTAGREALGEPTESRRRAIEKLLCDMIR